MSDLVDDEAYDNYISSYQHRLHELSANISSTFESPVTRRSHNLDGRQQEYTNEYRYRYPDNDSSHREQHRQYLQRKPVRNQRPATEVRERDPDEERRSARYGISPPTRREREPGHRTSSQRAADYTYTNAPPPLHERRRGTTEHMRLSDNYSKPRRTTENTRVLNPLIDDVESDEEEEYGPEDEYDDGSSLGGYSHRFQAENSRSRTPPAIASALHFSLAPYRNERQGSVRFSDEYARSQPRSERRNNLANSSTSNGTIEATLEGQLSSEEYHRSFETQSPSRASSSSADSIIYLARQGQHQHTTPRPTLSSSATTSTATSLSSPSSTNGPYSGPTSPNSDRRRSFFSLLLPPNPFSRAESGSETSSLSSSNTTPPTSSPTSGPTITTHDGLRHDPEAHNIASLDKIWCFRMLDAVEPTWTAFDYKNQRVLKVQLGKMKGKEGETTEVQFYDSHIVGKKKKVRIFLDTMIGCYTGTNGKETVTFKVDLLEVNSETTFIYNNNNGKKK